MSFDQTLFEAIQSLTGISALDSLMVFLAEYLVVLVPLTLVFLWLQDRKGKYDSSLTFTAAVTGIAVSYIMGLFYSHQNPSATYETIVAFEPENAFPSQHTAVMFSAVWPLVYRERKKLGALMAFAAITTGFARVYMGEHWPVDILGALVASFSGMVTVYLAEDRIGVFDPIFEFSETLEQKIFNLF